VLGEITMGAEMESALAMTPEEMRVDPAAARYDLGQVDAQADAFFASLDERVKKAKAAPELGRREITMGGESETRAGTLVHPPSLRHPACSIPRWVA
jgi:hypothetical protein